VRLGACIGDTLATLEPALRRRRLRAELREAEPVEGRVDAGAVAEVVLNLVVNAMRHAFPGATAGRVDVEVGRAPGGGALLRVRDSGRGIAPEDLPRIFDAGFTTGADSGGTGLGLSTVKEIVERRLRGSIAVESVPGRGTSFEARFPLD
jgi:signal transduction histidine kinase